MKKDLNWLQKINISKNLKGRNEKKFTKKNFTAPEHKE